MLEWANRAVAAYNKEAMEKEQQRERRYKDLAVAVSLLVGHVCEPQSDSLTLSYAQHMATMTFKFMDEQSRALVVMVWCNSCRKHYQCPVPTRAALGKLFVKGFPPHDNCLNEILA